MSPLVAGLTVVSMGTSAPEMCVSLSSALHGHADIALGNVVGSNIFNIAVILGLAALILPLEIHMGVIRRDIPVMIVASLVVLGFLSQGNLPRALGIGLLVGLVVYLYFTIRYESKSPQEDAQIEEPQSFLTKSWWLDLLVLGVGLGVLVFGSQLFVDGASALARMLGVSEAVIGLTIVAAGTGMPELATSVVAALRRQSDIAVGNVVGSNIFNLLFILGATTSVSPISGSQVGLRDGAVMAGLSMLLLPFAVTHLKITRPEGAALLLAYGGYLYLLWP